MKDIRFPLSLRNELAAMERLLALVKGGLAGYPTSLEEDRALLKARSIGRLFKWRVFLPSLIFGDGSRVR